MRDQTHGLPLADRRWRLLTYSKCFLGSDAVTWMTKNLSQNREASVVTGQRLMDAGIIHHVTHSELFSDSEYYYRFQEDDESNILNMKRVWDSSIPTRHAVEVAKDLLTRLALLCEDHRKHVLSPELASNSSSAPVTGPSVSTPIIPPSPRAPSSTGERSAQSSSPHLMRSFSTPPLNTGAISPLIPSSSGMLSSPPTPVVPIAPMANGDDVDYSTLAKSEPFRKYTLAAAELQRVQLVALNHDERMCFFVNLYNILCLHAHVTQGPPNNVLRRYTFFRAMSYRVGGLDMTLDDIEHGILRGNKRPPMIMFIQQLRPSDPKCQHVLTKRDGRLHFVISAGTRSDPPIRILDGDNVQEELHHATVEFLSCTVKVDVEKRCVTLPRIFLWYSEDFPSPEKNLLMWVARYLPVATSGQLVNLVHSEQAMPKISYENFDWANAEARFNASVVRRKRRKLERERSASLAALDIPLMAPVNEALADLISANGPQDRPGAGMQTPWDPRSPAGSLAGSNAAVVRSEDSSRADEGNENGRAGSVEISGS